MPGAVSHIRRLALAGLVFAEHGVRFVPKGTEVPLPLRAGRLLARIVSLITWPFRRSPRRRPGESRIAAALTALGPSYIKAGQFLAARPDLVGPELASDLKSLQDKMAPFADTEARATIRAAFGQEVETLYAEFGPPVAAASIAQVHKATIQDLDGNERTVAVKILRPGIERQFADDIASFRYAARQIERLAPTARRLRPLAVVGTLEHSMKLEIDLRLEAAAISEMAENIKDDPGFRVPAVDWQRTAKTVLTTEWIDGIPIADKAALETAGFDVRAIGETVIRSFLRHAMRDGFFHADMHQGNLFVDADGTVVAVDFGIMGRLSAKERRFLAEILYGFIARDYRRAAEAHFAAGYVPAHHSVEVFAQALRAIGEPLNGRPAEDISMGHLLGQLFAYTDVFDMETRPELILLQKTMVVVEGVARHLDPTVNIWTAAEPVVRSWMEKELGLEGRLAGAREGVDQLGQFASELPRLLLQAERAAGAFSAMAEGGLRLEDDTIRRLAAEEARKTRSGRIALWVGALSLLALLAAAIL
ncbi:MAG: 2-polyprenylphenol 6-hydroxylase [Hyphomicrobiaceae bacterium]